MARHYFHCSDGRDLVIDRTGHEAPGIVASRLEALRHARSMMAELRDYDGWAGWSVHIYDALGEVAIVPFSEAMVPDEPAAPPARSRRKRSGECQPRPQKTQASKIGSTLPLHAPR